VGLQPPKSLKLVIFGINLPKRGIAPWAIFFIQNLPRGRESQVCTFMPNFTVVAVKMWAYSPKIAKNGNFWYTFAPKRKFWGSTEKVEYRCTTTNFPACNDTIIIVLKITLLHSVSVITNFVIPKRDKKKQKKTSHFFVPYSRRTTHNQHHTWHGDRGGPYQFCTSWLFFDPISSFAARLRGYWKFKGKCPNGGKVLITWLFVSRKRPN